MGTPLDSFFFCAPKKKSVTGLGIFGRSDQKVFRYDERAHDMIRSDRKKIIFVKSLMGTEIDSFFLSEQFDSLCLWNEDSINK